jgi:redox-regulated HSP33 family molecular chaperone
MTAPGDLLHRFLFEDLPVRGHLVRLDASWRAAIEHHDYPRPVSDLLGEAMAAAVLMADALKFEGRLALQFEGRGPVRLMLAQCTHRHAIRGVARKNRKLRRAIWRWWAFICSTSIYSRRLALLSHRRAANLKLLTPFSG